MRPEENHRELLARALADELTPEEAGRLLEACRRDPALLAEFSRLTVIERLLAYAHLYGDDAIFVREVGKRIQSQDAVPPKVIRLSSWQRPWWHWAAAAIVLLVTGGTIGVWHLRPSGAVVLRMEAITLASGQPPLKENHPLPARRVKIEAGLLKLQFASGATVILEGPADFEIQGSQQCRLRRGKAVARVPEAARGFILDAPHGRLVDLGTEFGVNVAASGDMDVHVIEGLVEATPTRDSTPRQLKMNEAARISSAALLPLTANANAFVTDLPLEFSGTVGFVHWSFDEGQGQASANHGLGLGPSDPRATLHTFPDGGSGPAWTAGQFGSGLYFDGQDDYVECNFPGIAGTRPRTVAFWVKVPQDFKPEQGYGIINWGKIGPPGAAWQISVNPTEEAGPLGRLRMGTHLGWIVGTTDLRDNRWHHCAVVMYGGHRPNTATHVLLYVDGELEPAARKAVREIATDTSGPEAHGIWLGRNLNTSPDEPGHFFRGWVDEVFIFDAALGQEQIRSLVKHNRLPPPSLQAAASSAP